MRHYVYRIEHTPTERWYVGIRTCTCAPENDTGYWGSGTVIRQLLAAHDRSEFTKTILAVLPTREAAADLERELVDLSDSLCINLCEGGGPGLLGYTHTEESRAKMSAAQRERWQDPEFRDSMIEAQTRSGKRRYPRMRKAMLAGTARKWADPKYRERMTEMGRSLRADPARSDRNRLGSILAGVRRRHQDLARHDDPADDYRIKDLFRLADALFDAGRRDDAEAVVSRMKPKTRGVLRTTRATRARFLAEFDGSGS